MRAAALVLGLAIPAAARWMPRAPPPAPAASAETARANHLLNMQVINGQSAILDGHPVTVIYARLQA